MTELPGRSSAGQVLTSQREVCGGRGTPGFEFVANLVSNLAFGQSLVCAGSPYRHSCQAALAGGQK
jgi:hypothetical protein